VDILAEGECHVTTEQPEIFTAKYAKDAKK
jgi:hypothetical protein